MKTSVYVALLVNMGECTYGVSFFGGDQKSLDSEPYPPKTQPIEKGSDWSCLRGVPRGSRCQKHKSWAQGGSCTCSLVS